MDVIIVSKTHMLNHACVGGVLANGKFVRLLNSDGYNQDSDTDMEIGKVYSITYTERRDKIPPHVEDILVNSITYKFTFATILKMVDYLKNELKIQIWRGNPNNLFDGKLQWTSGGSGYISKRNIPEHSVGFWISDRHLNRNDYNDKVRFHYPVSGRNITYVGYQNPVNIIPSGTLIRVSLARWWSPNDDEEKCYLQLSGWYGIPETQTVPKRSVPEDDLPF